MAPENTLAGIRLAARLGFRAVEFDVMLTADEIPILIHDETLRRTTGHRGRVARTEWAVIAGLDAGASFHPAWAGEPVPRLDDALAVCADLGLAVNMEIKPAAGHDRRTAEVVAETVAGSWPSAQGLLISSFSLEALAVAAEVVPSYPRALLLSRIPEDWPGRLKEVRGVAIHTRAAGLSAARVAELGAAGVPVAAYTVNAEAEAGRCLGLGVAALFTDRLDRLGPA